MRKITFRFYEELNDFLSECRRKVDFTDEFKAKMPLKDMIEAFGIPRDEVDLILANRKSVSFDYIPQDGDRISVYPVFESLNIKNLTRLRKIPLRKTRFIADHNLEDIVKHIRLMGFDVVYNSSLSDRELIKISNRKKRIILTKRKELLKSKDIKRAVYIRPGTTEKQAESIIDRLDIKDQAKSL